MKMQHLGRADAVDDVDAKMALNRSADLGRQRRRRMIPASTPPRRAGSRLEASMPATP
jgi:hypothetical protein